MDDEQLNSYDAKFDIGILRQPGALKKFRTSTTPSTEVARGLDYGKSKYDVGLLSNVSLNQDARPESFGPQELISENRAQRQPWIAKFGAGLGRTVAKTATEITKLAPVLGGVIVGGIEEMIDSDKNNFLETAFNNPWIKGLDHINETVNTELLPVYVKKAVQDGNLWENFKSIDFWATEGADGLGYMLAMLAPGAIINKLGVGQKLFSGINKIGAMGAKVDDAASVLGKIGFTPGGINVTTAAIGNTIFEAGAEAKGAGDSYEAKMRPKLEAGEISQDEFDRGKGEVMRDVFVSNAIILAGPNLVMAKMIWGKGANKAAGTVVDEAGKVVSQLAPRTLKHQVGDFAKTFAQGAVREGFFEEGMQSVAEGYHVDKAVKGKQSGEGFMGALEAQFNLLGDLAPEYVDMISTVEGQKAILLGAMMGGPMQATMGLIQKNKEHGALNKLLPELSKLDSYYQIFNEDIYNDKNEIDITKFKAKAEAIGLSEQLSEAFDKAVASGDKKTIEGIRAYTTGELIKNFIFNDELGINALTQYFENSKTIEEIAQKDQVEVKDIVDSTISRAKKLQQDFNTFSEFAPALIKLENENATLEDKKRYYNGLASSYISNKNLKYFYESQINKTKETRSNLLESLGLSKKLETGDIKLETAAKDNFALKQLNDDVKEYEELLETINVKDNEYWKTTNHVENFNQQVKVTAAMEEASKEANIKLIETIQTAISDAKTVEELESIKFTGTIADKALKVAVELKKKEIIKQGTIQEKEQEVKQKTKTEETKEAKEVIEEQSEEEVEYIAGNYNVGEIIPLTNELITASEGQLDDSDLYNNAILESENNESITLNIIETGAQVIIKKKPTKEVEPNVELEFNTEGSENHDSLIPKLNENKETGKEEERGNGTPIVTYDRVKKEKLPNTSDKFVILEQEPTDKKGVIVNFTINTTAGKIVDTDSPIIKTKKSAWNLALKIYDRLKAGEKLTTKEIESLINDLPINILLGEEQAPIHTKYTSNGNSNKFDNSSKLLRTKIINALLEGNSIENITSEIEGQYGGELQVAPKVDDKVAENSILDLHFLFRIVENQRINEVKKRMGFVNKLGQLQFLDGSIDPYFKQSKGIGELYMMIPKANGKPFPLKLNIQKINKVDADLLARIYEIRVKNDTIEKSTSLSEIEDKELLEQIKTTFGEQIKLIGKSFNDVTVKDIVDFLIWDMTKNGKTRVRFTGTSVKGESVFVYGNPSLTGKVVNNPSEFDRENFSQWLQDNKRYNINIKPKKGSTTKATIATNNSYLEYLLNNRIVNTNAVVGESTPTFQGFSGLYINSDKVVTTGKEEIRLQEETKENFEDVLEPSQEITYKGKKYTVAIVNGNGVITNEKGKVILSSSPIGTAIQNLVNWDTLEENKPEKIRKSQKKVVPLHEVPNTEESKKVEVLKKQKESVDPIEVSDEFITKMIIDLTTMGQLQLGSDLYKNIMNRKTNAEKFEVIKKMAEDKKLNIDKLILKCK